MDRGHCSHPDPVWAAPPLCPDMIFGKAGDSGLVHIMRPANDPVLASGLAWHRRALQHADRAAPPPNESAGDSIIPNGAYDGPQKSRQPPYRSIDIEPVGNA